MSAQKQVIVELDEAQKKEIREEFGEEFTDMIVHYDSAGRVIGEMIKSGGAGSSFKVGVTVTGGSSATVKAGLKTGGSSPDDQADPSDNPGDKQSDEE